METNKNKYSLGNFKFLQYFAEPQGGGGSGEGGNPEGSDGQVGGNTGDEGKKDEHLGNDGTTNTDQNTNKDNGDDGEKDKDEVFDKPYVESLRKENAKYRTRAKETQDQFETFANDLKSFLEKNGVKVDSNESKTLLEGLDGIVNNSRSTVLNAELERVSAQMNIVDADILSKLLDVDALKFENGRYVGLEEQVKAIAEAKPYLVKQTQQQDTKPPKGGQGTGGAPKKLTQSDLERMTPKQISEALVNGELTHLLG